MSILANTSIIWMSGKENNFLVLLKNWAIGIVFSRLVTLISYFVQLQKFVLSDKTQWEQGILFISHSWNSLGFGIRRTKDWVFLREPKQINSSNPCWYNDHSNHICRDFPGSILLCSVPHLIITEILCDKFDLMSPMGLLRTGIWGCSNSQ